MEGKQIAGYVIENMLGEGGMGVVYRARDATLDRAVAVKVIHSQKLGEQGKERFLREARACSRINHPNIITVYAAGEEDGCPYIAMELIDGKTLRQIIDEGPIEWKKATRCLIDLLDAVGRLHEEGIVHRDLKPENIMITKDGVVKLMDFGLAHLQSSTTLTEEGTTLGTISYMSPEQVMGNKADARSDLFSIASVFHEMITGLHPFRGEHPMAVMYSIRNDTPRALKLASQELPVGMQAVLDRAFEKEIDKRYQDAKTFREELIALLPAEVLNGSRITSGGTVGRKGSLTPAVIVAAAILIAGGIIGWNALRDGPRHIDHEAAVNLNELGQDKQDAGYIDEAITLFRESIRADDTYPIPWNNLALITLNQNELAEADSLFREALERDSTYAGAWYNLGALADARDDHTQAHQLYERAIHLKPDFAEAYNNLGSLQLRMGKYETARKTLNEGLRLRPKEPVRTYLMKNRGLVAHQLSNPDSARYYLFKVQPNLPNDEEVNRVLIELSR